MLAKRRALQLVSASLLASLLVPEGANGQFFADWSVLARDRTPSCVPIPANMSLCTDVGYTKMRLPNLLDHDTMQEASQQASSWVPLLNVKCHEDTQLFLCSLFAPLCLERPIYPCRSLCQKVKSGCLSTMENHGFPWPSMLDCDKFPMDNDMCITSQSDKKDKGSGAKSGGGEGSASGKKGSKPECKAKLCNQVGTYENILANYCQADFVVKMKFKEMRRRTAVGRKVNAVYKTWRGTPQELRKLRKPRLRLRESDDCCSGWLSSQPGRQRYLVMGKRERGTNGSNRLVPTFIHPWKKSNEDLKRARRMFQQMDCSNLRETSHRVIAQSIAPHSLYQRETESRKRRRTLKSMFDFGDYDATPDITGPAGIYRSQILGNPGPAVRSKKGPNKEAASSRTQSGKRRTRHSGGRSGLKRRSRLQENWLESVTAESQDLVKSRDHKSHHQHENEVFESGVAKDTASDTTGTTTTTPYPMRRRPRNN